jgi:hypothetical protein
MWLRDGRKRGTRKGGREGGCKWREFHDVRGSVPSSVGTLSLGRIGGQNSNQTEGAKRAPRFIGATQPHRHMISLRTAHFASTTDLQHMAYLAAIYCALHFLPLVTRRVMRIFARLN